MAVRRETAGRENDATGLKAELEDAEDSACQIPQVQFHGEKTKLSPDENQEGTRKVDTDHS